MRQNETRNVEWGVAVPTLEANPSCMHAALRFWDRVVDSIEKRGSKVGVWSPRFVGVWTAKAWQATKRHANGSIGPLDILEGWSELLPATATGISPTAATFGAGSVAVISHHEDTFYLCAFECLVTI